ncbi:MAG: PTS sugar transporter subunit IIA [Streptococcaceae bacterium]|jgi:PTS system ascorbate-specific IIA component|nr:PTS sugar transporter subunit IIA [Streptococcaceae bacterium]MCH4178154.1 PTS sugar transporter subunit IIA [Streptococcaceae bacterium]
MLNYFIDNDLVRFVDEQPVDWEQAIRISCEMLVEKKFITDAYIEEIVDGVRKYGPYIVIIPGVAMPHSTDKSEGVLGTAVSFTKFPKKVYFEAGNEEKQAKLFFTLAAKDADAHMENIANLSEMLMTDGLVEKLEEIGSVEALREIIPYFGNA